MMQKKIILCADDYGQNAEISEGILQLAQQQRLSAVSCMVNGHAWQTYANFLKEQTTVQKGLHLNFTHGQALSKPLNFSNLLGLLKTCYFPNKEFETFVTQEIKTQILCFKQTMGFWPQFIDGHQHVHQLPVIRQALINVVKALDFKPWFRITACFDNLNCSTMTSWKKLALLVLGGQTWKQLLNQHDFAHPSDFSGEYSFNQAISYRHIFLKAAEKLKNNGLIMCHPGLQGSDKSDPIASARRLEFEYFQSPLFLEDLGKLNISLF